MRDIPIVTVPAGAEAALAAFPRQLTAWWVWLGLFLALVAAGLLLPVPLSLGPNYWDTAVYLDAFRRIASGQMPGRDFFAPVGPLGYYLGFAFDRLFPRAQPILLVNWALLPVVLPALVAIGLHVAARSRLVAFALIVPFLIFALLPINFYALYVVPGFDGYGHYNRHVALMLYLLVAALLFVDETRLKLALVAWLMLALVLTKITGAVVGALFVGQAVLSGRMAFRHAALAAALVVALLAALQLATGIVGFYLGDILTLLQLNTGVLLSRFLTVASTKFGVIAPAVLLVIVLAMLAWREVPRSRQGLGILFASPFAWFAVVLAGLAFFETQNTGSLEFIGLWPVLLWIMLEWLPRRAVARPLVLGLALATALPTLLVAVERGARATLAMPTYRALGTADIGPLGRVLLKPDIAERARTKIAFYAAHRETYEDLVRRDILPSYLMYSEIDHQAIWLLEIQQAVTAIPRWEAQNGRRLASLMTMDFADPLPYLLGRTPARHVPIGADPSRSVPPFDAAQLADFARVDAVLAPQCPPTTARAALAAHFAPVLEGRRRVALAPCWAMYVRD